MEIQILNYFLEIAREGNMTRASKSLHISQSSLSKQMKELENELGKPLFIRTRQGLSLTDEGMLLRKRAEDIVAMVDKTTAEFASLDEITGGDIHIGCAESYLIKYLARGIKTFKANYPLLKFHLFSGDTSLVTEHLDRGLLDFAVIVEPPDLSKYNYIEIPDTDKWGLVIKKDHPLASKSEITVDDLIGIDLICSPQSIKADIPRWCGEKADSLNYVGTGNLTYNGSVFVQEGLGCLLTFDHLANTSKETGLLFRPLSPALETKMYIIWKKYQVFTPIAELLIKWLASELG